MPYADSNGVKLYYEETGAGVPIIFVHEFGGDYMSWEPQVRHFSRRYRCITFNARGYPPSDVPENGDAYSQEIARDDVVNVLRHLEIERAHVVGLSMGSFAALHVGVHYAEMAMSIVVAGGGYGALPAVHEQFQAESRASADQFEKLGVPEVAPAYGAHPFRTAFRDKDPRGYEEFQERLAAHSTLGAVLTMRGVQAQRPAYTEFEDALRAMTVPVLIIAGDEDDPSLESSLYLKRTVPSAALCVLPKSGHAMNLEEPALFNRFVEDFIDTVQAGRWQTREAPLPEKIL